MIGVAAVGVDPERAHAASHCRGGFRRHVGLVFEPWLPEMHLVVDHSWQQSTSGGIHDVLAVARSQSCTDIGDATAGNAQVAVEFTAFVDQSGIDDQGVGHGRSI